jgi:hypothetical protein
MTKKIAFPQANSLKSVHYKANEMLCRFTDQEAYICQQNQLKYYLYSTNMISLIQHSKLNTCQQNSIFYSIQNSVLLSKIVFYYPQVNNQVNPK